MVRLINTKDDIVRVPIFVDGLDEQMQGGVPEDSVVLVSGTSGSMKSSLSFNVIYYNAIKGRNSIYLSLEQSYSSLLNHIINMGFDLSLINLVIVTDLADLDNKIKDAKDSKLGSLFIVDLGVLRKELKDTKIGEQGDWLNVIKNVLKRMKLQMQLDLFVLDSLSALYVLSQFTNPRVELFHIFEFLRDVGLTTFLISEMPLDKTRYSQYEVEDYLSDGIIYLEMTKEYRKVLRSIQIVKMRATKTDLNMYTLEFSDGKFRALYGGEAPLV
ncbi:MAG: hypothetical protein GWP09_02430 [Nitrospiraceae bacterium]|nr:hypothetical protein [Nitrospiraceae bacterium]